MKLLGMLPMQRPMFVKGKKTTTETASEENLIMEFVSQTIHSNGSSFRTSRDMILLSLMMMGAMNEDKTMGMKSVRNV